MSHDRAVLLPGYLAAARTLQLRPGAHDCALFAAGWVRLCSGVDLAKRRRGRYYTLEQGAALLAGDGISDPIELAERHLTELNGWMQALVGDVAVVQDVDGAGSDYTGFGIVGGCHIHVVGLRGLDYVPLRRAVRVFRP
ncbi:MAG: hypothetical protein COC12_07025 [Rhodobacteraceae bacterium]|nr:MAG: hypothetical protein COC12_07025 [Paracoccaceae bacterium]